MSMKEIKIRKLEKTDMDDIQALHETRDNATPEKAKQRTELLAWAAFNNPYAENGEITYYAAENQGKVVAFHGCMPVKLNVDGEKVKAYYVHDLYVGPEYRKKGLGFWLTMNLAKAIEDETDGMFALLGMTALNLQMQRRRGYLELDTDGYSKLINPKKYVKRYLKNGMLTNVASPVVKAGLGMADFFRLAFASSSVKVSEIERFDARFDDLSDKIIAKSKIATIKSADYLNWKYVDRPYKRETILAAEKNGQVTGFVVLAFTPADNEIPVGAIVDIDADPSDEETIAALCRASIKHFRQRGAGTINCLMNDPRFGKVLKKYQFLDRPGKKLMLGNLDRCEDYKGQLENIKNWHMTLGESDAYMLST